MLTRFRPTLAEIDLDAFARNLDAITSRLPPASRLIAMMKAGAYGHGAVELARICEERGNVAMISVALVEEAVELRAAGITLPILIVGPVTAPQIPIILRERFVLGVSGPEVLASLASAGGEGSPGCTIHLELDSGMGRMGLVDGDLSAAAGLLRENRWIDVGAIYTHFANASDPDDPVTFQQIEVFRRMLRRLRELGVEAPLHHLANSAAVMRDIVTPGDWARTGIALYGAEALDRESSRLEPVMTWRTEIARLKEVPAGSGIGYGLTYHTRRTSRIATLPVGYADGYDRRLSNQGVVLLHGRRAPVVGRVSMDLVTIDVTEIELAAAGDPVVLLGRQGNEQITADEIAAKIGTISYEILCGVSARVPRLYRKGSDLRVVSKFNEIMDGSRDRSTESSPSSRPSRGAGT